MIDLARIIHGIKERLPGGGIYDRRKMCLGNDDFLKLYSWYYNEIYFKGRRNVKIKEDILKGDYFEFCGLSFPVPKTESDFKTLMVETPDLLFPYRFRNDDFDYTVIEKYFDEGPYEIDENVCLNKGDIVIDCGANMGLFSNIALAKFCEVYAFEPSKAMKTRYLDNYNSSSLHIEEYALSDRTDQEIEFIEEIEQEGASYLAGIEDKGAGYYAFASKLKRAKAGNSTISYKINTITLDDWVQKYSIKKVDFIKADIEGSERFMLRGATSVLRNFAPKLSICTYHFKDDPRVLENIIRQANPNYIIEHKYKKLYAYVPKK